MSDEEKLKAYLRQNAQKPKPVEEPEPEVTAPIKYKGKETPGSWYSSRLWPTFRWTSIFGTFFTGVLFLAINDRGGLDRESAFTIGGSIWVIFMAVNIAITVRRLTRYSKWIKGGYYKLIGWNEFFAKRTKDFWEERNYTYVQITFNLTPDATDLHRQVRKAFLNKMVEKWNKGYQDKDLEWTGKAPKDFQANGEALYGDVSQRELLTIVKMLAPRFIPVSKMLGTKLQDVVIKSDSKEVTHNMREEKEDSSENARQWDAINSSDKD